MGSRPAAYVPLFGEISVSERKKPRGVMCGEENPRAQLSDDDVELIRQLFEASRFDPVKTRFWTVGRLAEKFEVSQRHIYNIVSYRQRVAPLDDPFA